MMQLSTRCRWMETCGMPGIWQLSASSVADKRLILYQLSQDPHTCTEPISAADRVLAGSSPRRSGHITGQGSAAAVRVQSSLSALLCTRKFIKYFLSFCSVLWEISNSFILFI